MAHLSKYKNKLLFHPVEPVFVCKLTTDKLKPQHSLECSYINKNLSQKTHTFHLLLYVEQGLYINLLARSLCELTRALKGTETGGREASQSKRWRRAHMIQVIQPYTEAPQVGLALVSP